VIETSLARGLGQTAIWNGRCWPKLESYLSQSRTEQQLHGGSAAADVGQQATARSGRCRQCRAELQAELNRSWPLSADALGRADVLVTI